MLLLLCRSRASAVVLAGAPRCPVTHHPLLRAQIVQSSFDRGVQARRVGHILGLQIVLHTLANLFDVRLCLRHNARTACGEFLHISAPGSAYAV
jgi:hypothetical protein